jgi:hypothetical protein
VAISKLSSEFFPEILGMTLYFEWLSGPDVARTIKLFDYYGLDPHFYILHRGVLQTQRMTCKYAPSTASIALLSMKEWKIS